MTSLVLQEILLLFKCCVVNSMRLIVRGFMRFSAIRPKWWASNEIGAKSFRLTMDTLSSPESAQ
jgi:hypothetical protein